MEDAKGLTLATGIPEKSISSSMDHKPLKRSLGNVTIAGLHPFVSRRNGSVGDLRVVLGTRMPSLWPSSMFISNSIMI